MPVNYHTHTFRCGHAENVPDEAYLQRAIEQGFTVLGFSDHTPWQGLSTNSSTCVSGRAMKRQSNIWRVWGFRLCSGCFNLVSNRFSARTCNSGAQLV